MGPIDWWANLLQGAVSAMLGGVVAALTAWGVVKATKRNERKLARELDARVAARELIVELNELINKIAEGEWVGSRRAVKELSKKVFVMWLLHAADLKGFGSDGRIIGNKLVSLAEEFELLATDAEQDAGRERAIEIMRQLLHIMDYLHAYLAADHEVLADYFLKWQGIDLDILSPGASPSDVEDFVRESLKSKREAGRSRRQSD
ncbi:hypothetical protein AB0J35_60115 [Nonomuraea angiospora]|uniref:hypothetical protein n=1 Tax=Nonomuraea angiospora TaxID=46172 RepID=UPI0034295538